jgi:Uma2 family endonuclease
MQPARHRYTFEDYLAVEEMGGVKHEFFDGEIYAMAGGTPEHAALAALLTALLVGQLRGKPCRVYSSDLRVRILATGLATYPDVTVVCGPLERDPESPTNVTNPTLVVEVLSQGTEDYDRGEKRLQYQRVPSLKSVVLVSHREPRIDVWTRGIDGFELQTFGPGALIDLSAIGCQISLDEVYEATQGG